MASGTYISINTATIGTVSAQAASLGTSVETTRNELISLQGELSEAQNVIGNYLGICYDDAIPTKRLMSQKSAMEEIVSLLAQAEQLAEEASNNLNTKTSALQLAVEAMKDVSGTAYATALSVISAALSGETDTGDDWAYIDNWILEEMKERYQRTLKAAGRTTFSGRCSAFVYRQLRDIGVFSAKDSGIELGKDYYSVWSKKSQTSTGYQIESYGYDKTKKNNPLSDLINAHPGESLSNIVVSFNYDGKNYTSSAGHVVLITAIEDGYVYYMESASGSLYNLKGGQKYAEGEPIKLTVNDFIKQYPNMNGVVHFYE